jgi:hypothetical protein
MPAATYNIIADQGATFSRVITWKSSTGTPVDLTGYTAKMQVRVSYTSASAVLTLSTAAGSIVLGGALGTITITGQASAMTMDGNNYVYDLELTSGGGAVTRLIMGNFTVRAEVTQ